MTPCVCGMRTKKINQAAYIAEMLVLTLPLLQRIIIEFLESWMYYNIFESYFVKQLIRESILLQTFIKHYSVTVLFMEEI